MGEQLPLHPASSDKMFHIVCIVLAMVLFQANYGMNTACEIRGRYGGDTPLATFEPLVTSSDEYTHMHDNITLECSFNNYCYITWYHNGIVIDASANQSTIFRITEGNQSLVIDDVMEIHHGSYQCIASNGTNTISHKSYLTVHGVETSELVIFNSDVSEYGGVYLRQQLTLLCYAYNFIDITWYHDDQLITPEEGRVTFLDMDQVLIIQEFTPGDDGGYKCVASNETHNVSREGFVKYNRLCLDDELLLNSCTPSGDTISAALGSNLNVTCTYSVGAGMIGFRGLWYRIDSTAGDDQLNETMFYYAPYFDDSAQAGTFYDVKYDKTAADNPNCTIVQFWEMTLLIENVTEGTYGYYVAYAYKFSAVESRIIQIIPEIEEVATPIVYPRTVGTTVGVSVLLLLLGCVIWRRYHLDIRLFANKTRESIMSTDANNDEKDGYLYDVYIACADADTGVVINRFLPALREKGYSTFLRITDVLPGEGTHDEIWRCMKASRSCLLLISNHQFYQENVGLVEVQAAVHNLSCKKKGIIPVLLQHLTESEMDAYPILGHLVRTNPKLLCRRGDLANPKRFRTSSVFKGMRLALPPPSERRKGRAGIAIRGYLDDEFMLMDDDAFSYSSHSISSDDLEMGRKAPEIVITTTT